MTQPTQTLAELATQLPSASRVFQRHHLDFCCHGDRTLSDACSAAGVDVDAVVEEIEAAHRADAGTAVRWDERPLVEVIDHILDDYHAPLYAELDHIGMLADKVLEVHGAAHPDVLPPLVTLIRGLFDELRMHMSKEENVLFPWIKSGQGKTAQGPIRVMLMEHDDAGAQLEQLRALTDDFEPPAHACVTWVALYVRLQDFDRELREHIHLENHVLFPRALRE